MGALLRQLARIPSSPHPRTVWRGRGLVPARASQERQRPIKYGVFSRLNIDKSRVHDDVEGQLLFALTLHEASQNSTSAVGCIIRETHRLARADHLVPAPLEPADTGGELTGSAGIREQPGCYRRRIP
jgi:hypothetical protein